MQVRCRTSRVEKGLQFLFDNFRFRPTYMATSWENAKKLNKKFGGRVDFSKLKTGFAVAFFSNGYCSIDKNGKQVTKLICFGS